jgi:hypothetical protein
MALTNSASVQPPMPNFGSGVMLGVTKAGRGVAGRAVAGDEHLLPVGEVGLIARRQFRGRQLARRGDQQKTRQPHKDQQAHDDQTAPKHPVTPTIDGLLRVPASA